MEKIIIRIIVIEDEEVIAKPLIRHLDSNLRSRQYKCEFIWAKNIEEYNDITSSPPKDVYMVDRHIVDINLNGASKVEGLEVIQSINQSDELAKPIVLTGSPDSREACYSLGIKKNRFFLKGRGSTIPTIIKTIKEDIKEVISDYKEGRLDRFKSIKSKIEVEIKQKGEIEIPPNMRTIEKTYVLSNLEEIYRSIDSPNSKLALLKLLLTSFSSGYSYYSTDKELIETYTSKKEIINFFEDKVVFELIQDFSPKTDYLEQLTLIKKGEVFFEIIISSFEDIVDYFKKGNSVLNHSNDFIKTLAIVFCAKRLSEFYINAKNKKEKNKIIRLALNIGEKHLVSLELAATIKEWILSNNIKEYIPVEKEHKEIPEVKDILYGSVESKNEKDGMVEVLLASIKNLKKKFVRAFELKLFSKHGVSNPSSNFKLIIYNDKTGDGEKTSFFIEPIPRKIYQQKLANA